MAKYNSIEEIEEKKRILRIKAKGIRARQRKKLKKQYHELGKWYFKCIKQTDSTAKIENYISNYKAKAKGIKNQPKETRKHKTFDEALESLIN